MNHPQTNGRVERFNRTMSSALRLYVAEHQHHWDLYSDTLPIGYINQGYTSTYHSSFELVLVHTLEPLALQRFGSLNGKQTREVEIQFLDTDASTIVACQRHRFEREGALQAAVRLRRC